MEFAIGGLAAAGAGFFTNPIQVSKAHLKVSAEMVHRGRPNAPYKNAFHAGYLVAKREGILALQKGLTSSLWMHLIKYGVKLGKEKVFSLIDTTVLFGFLGKNTITVHRKILLFIWDPETKILIAMQPDNHNSG